MSDLRCQIWDVNLKTNSRSFLFLTIHLFFLTIHLTTSVRPQRDYHVSTTQPSTTQPSTTMHLNHTFSQRSINVQPAFSQLHSQHMRSISAQSAFNQRSVNSVTQHLRSINVQSAFNHRSVNSVTQHLRSVNVQSTSNRRSADVQSAFSQLYHTKTYLTIWFAQRELVSIFLRCHIWDVNLRCQSEMSIWDVISEITILKSLVIC